MLCTIKKLVISNKLPDTFYNFYSMTKNTTDTDFISKTIQEYNVLKYPNPIYIKYSDVIKNFAYLGINENSLKRYVADSLIRTKNVKVLVNGKSFIPEFHQNKETKITKYYAQEDFEFCVQLQNSRLKAEKDDRRLQTAHTINGKKLLITNFLQDKIELSLVQALLRSTENIFKFLLVKDLNTKFSSETVKEILRVYPDLSIK
jgi:hypothetical protein